MKENIIFYTTFFTIIILASLYVLGVFHKMNKLQKILLFSSIGLLFFIIFKPNPEKEIPTKMMTNNDWFVEEAYNLYRQRDVYYELAENQLYGKELSVDTYMEKRYGKEGKNWKRGKLIGKPGVSPEKIYISFGENGQLEGWENPKNCSFNGKYFLNEEKNILTISEIRNTNCSWVSRLNGKYIYAYDSKRKEGNKYMFRKGSGDNSIVITHLLNEQR